MLVLVINSGSSSLKYQVRDVEAGSVLAEGLVEKIGMGNGGGGDGEFEGPRDHAEALELVDAAIHAALGDRVLDAVGHRVVHGMKHSEPERVTSTLLKRLRFLPPYSPDFNPIEQAFAKLKAFLRAARPRSFDEVCRLIAAALTLFTTEECLAYLRHSGYSGATR